MTTIVTDRSLMRNSHLSWLIGAGLLLLAGASLSAEELTASGENPHPVQLRRPSAPPLSAMARLGRQIFFDASLSSSGRLSCASCHSPQDHYGPPNNGPVMLGGADLKQQGARAVPSLAYLERQPNFSIGPSKNDDDNPVNLLQAAAAARGTTLVQKTATHTGLASVNMVPQGGLFWDGRADTLQAQALFPLLDPHEMDGGTVERVAGKLGQAPYARRFVSLFGPGIFDSPRMLVSEAMFAVARYEFEDPSFHPYSSKFDYWLEGKARLTAAEMRGYRLFNDPRKANCGGCHLDRPTKDGLPPLFTDHEYEALGAPRNMALAQNGDPTHYDLGICGPTRTALASQTQYCGMFLTPTLRNVATRHAFFHNGVFDTLQQVLDFYNFRDTNPEKIYPRTGDGIAKYNDIPQRYWANVDVADPPFGRHPGETPAMTVQDERDIIAFLQTLTDGYQPAH